MAKFSGKIGYAETIETAPGVWEDKITERRHSGDILRNIQNTTTSENLNDDIVVAHEISIIANPYAKSNSHAMRYVWFMGAKWKIKSVRAENGRKLL